MTRRGAISLVLLAGVVAGCDDGSAGLPPDGGRIPDAGVVDAAADADLADAPTPSGADAGIDPGRDAGADAGGDAAGDAGPGADAPTCTAASCTPSSPCEAASCVDGQCVAAPRADGTVCAADAVCVAGACVARGCGDGWRDPASEACDDGNVAPDDACSPDCLPTAFAIAARSGESDRPGGPRTVIAADGRGEVLVVWLASRPQGRLALMARRYGPSGAARGPAVSLSEDLFAGWDPEPSVAGLAEGFAVAWSAPDVTGDDDGAGIALVGVGEDGVVAAVDVANLTTFGQQRAPVLLADGRGVLVAWVDDSLVDRRIVARRFDGTLSPLGPERVLAAGLGEHLAPVLAGSAEGFALAWTHTTFTGPSEVLARRFDAMDRALDAVPLLVSDPPASADALGAAEPALCARPGGYTVLWTTFADDVRGDVRGRDLGVIISASWPVASVADKPERAAVLGRFGPGLVALVQTGGGVTDAIRDLQLVFIGRAAPTDAPLVMGRLAGPGRQQAGALATSPAGLWLMWSDDATLPVLTEAALGWVLVDR
jgi:cysteine-rich repeat protein